MLISRNDSAGAAFGRIPAKELRFAGGGRRRRFWTSSPLDEKILGFSNRWYKPAMDSSVVHKVEPDLSVRVVTALYFCATKLEAFTGRGKGDYQSSHDLEDLMAVVDGRAELVEEIRAGPEDVRSYIAAEIRKLFATREFLDALPGYLLPDQASQARVSILLDRLKNIAAL
jgi:hypothetical protein